MPYMSSMDANFCDAQDLIYALQNPAPASPLVKIGNGQKEELRTLAKILSKTNPPAVHPRVPVREVVEKKIQQVNQQGTQMKSVPQSKTFTNVEPLRVPIV